MILILAEIPNLAGEANLGEFGMYSHVHFAAVAAWLLVAIVGLLWVMACAVTTVKMEKEGIAFCKGCLASLVLSPLAGLITIFFVRILRPAQPPGAYDWPRLDSIAHHITSD